MSTTPPDWPTFGGMRPALYRRQVERAMQAAARTARPRNLKSIAHDYGVHPETLRDALKQREARRSRLVRTAKRWPALIISPA